MYTLGIETSCDETSCAILRQYRVLSNVTISSLREHKKYGGVVPEIATRAHVSNIDTVVRNAVEKSGVRLDEIGLVAVTARPGLIGALVIGLQFAKGLALALSKPLVALNHLHAHLFAPFLNSQSKIPFPFLGVVVSGGHTELYYVEDFDRLRLVGKTRDDACGEVYDKVAKAYNLGYPGGPVIDRMFDERRKNDVAFKCGVSGLDVSFSGIKTALIYKKKESIERGEFNHRAKVSYVSSFQESIVRTLTGVIYDAARRYKLTRIVCGGGVMANRYLRARLQAARLPGMKLFITPLEYAGDNAAIVAGLGFYLYNKKGIRSRLDTEAEAN